MFVWLTIDSARKYHGSELVLELELRQCGVTPIVGISNESQGRVKSVKRDPTSLAHDLDLNFARALTRFLVPIRA